MEKLVGDKAEAFAEEASTLGWEVELTRDGERSTVTAVRGNKELSISWRGAACLNETILVEDGHTRKLRNAGAARRKLEEEAGEPLSTAQKSETRKPIKTASSKATKPETKPKRTPKEKPVPFKSTPKPKTILPFDPSSATDAEILRAVIGKRIVWKNRLSGGYDEARVMDRPNQRQLKIVLNGRGERCLTFAEADPQRPDMAGGGFRSIRLSAITSVTTK